MTLSNFDCQRVLLKSGYYKGDIDGDIGPKSKMAIFNVLQGNHADWPLQRRLVAAVQRLLAADGFEPGPVDGYVGHNTMAAYTAWDRKQRGLQPDIWRSDDYTLQSGDALPFATKTDWGTQSEMVRRFGAAGGPQCTAGRVTFPWDTWLAWATDTPVKYYLCHELVADSAQRVLNRVASAYSPDKISDLGLDMYAGCFMFRAKRGGSSLSTHAWGIATDWDSLRNQLKWGRDRARLGRPDAEEWWRCWEAEGWLSLGRARNYDWMHVQAPGI